MLIIVNNRFFFSIDSNLSTVKKIIFTRHTFEKKNQTEKNIISINYAFLIILFYFSIIIILLNYLMFNFGT